MSITTEKTTLQVSFSKEKLEALKFYMDEKDTTVEKELQGHIKSIYEKYVPAATRRYLDRNDPGTEIQAEVTVEPTEAQQETASQQQPTTRGRRRNAREQNEGAGDISQIDSATTADENQEQIEDESQGMSMTM